MMSEAEVQAVKAREGERVLAQVKSYAHVIALDVGGELWSSEELAAQIGKLGKYGTSMSCLSSVVAMGSLVSH